MLELTCRGSHVDEVSDVLPSLTRVSFFSSAPLNTETEHETLHKSVSPSDVGYQSHIRAFIAPAAQSEGMYMQARYMQVRACFMHV